ncbi:MAG: hypothetical protein RLP15_07975 [Cryomorphaceae bacterium]
MKYSGRLTLKLAVICSVLLAMASCGKPSSTLSGDGLYRYQAEEFTDLAEDGVGGEGRIYVDNAHPYEDIMGAIMADAWNATIDGNGVEIHGLQISNIKVNEVVWEIGGGTAADSMIMYLEDARLVLEHFDGQETNISLGEMLLVDRPNQIVRFLPNEDDLTEWMAENRPDRMYFEYRLRDVFTPEAPLPVKYEILLSYNYTYEEREAKE